MPSCVWNILTKNYEDLVIDFQVTVENVGDDLFETQCISYSNGAICVGLLHCVPKKTSPTFSAVSWKPI